MIDGGQESGPKWKRTKDQREHKKRDKVGNVLACMIDSI